MTEQAARGYDAIKVYDNLDAEVYRAILETAREHGLPVVGHAPLALGLEGVLGGRQATIEHLTGYLDPDAAEFLIPEDQLDAYAARTREAGVWNVPTLSLYPKNSVSPERQAELERQPGQQYLSPARRAMNRFNYSQMSGTHTYAGENYPERIAALNRTTIHALHRAGAGLLLGTDALNPYQIPGYSAHEELAALVQAGLSPYEALRAGTHDAALALGQLDRVWHGGRGQARRPALAGCQSVGGRGPHNFDRRRDGARALAGAERTRIDVGWTRGLICTNSA